MAFARVKAGKEVEAPSAFCAAVDVASSNAAMHQALSEEPSIPGSSLQTADLVTLQKSSDEYQLGSLTYSAKGKRNKATKG